MKEHPEPKKEAEHPAEESYADALASARDEKLAEQQIYKEALEQKNKQIESYKDQLLRLKAEFENFRKRIDREKQDYLAWGKEEILMKIISLLDVLEKAHSQASRTDNIASVIQGLELIYKEFDKFVKSEGIEEIPARENKFDPHMHEAIGFVDVEQGEDNMVTEELRKGYRLRNRVIRPAQVRIARLVKKKNESGMSGTASNDNEGGPSPRGDSFQ